MQNTYVDIMIQSLNKKVQVLEEIKKVNLRQKEILEDDRAEVEDFDKTMKEKSALIEQMIQLDSGFEKLFTRVEEELNADKMDYVKQIKTMQSLIRQITDLSMELQVQEAHNKNAMTRKFVQVKERAKAVRTNTKAAAQYYQNMMGLSYVAPQFMDNKK